ncbi:FAD-dependent oxidoreductase [Streptomyces sp. NPDC021356]|uniref:NAD(P)/FAD-dependent oxidoreductase n=1 Tax=Streptomyces sp. NPDC021356 TaxID=3154900 RepID=UPI0033EFCC14
MTPPRTLVIVGYGMTAHRLTEELRSRDREGAWRILVLGDEPRPAYDRVALADRLAGATEADLELAGPRTRRDPLVQARTAAPVVGIERASRTVLTADGTRVPYDALVLATGAAAFRPPVPGADLPGCFPYRTLADVDAIRGAAAPGAPVVVVGGGLLGLETAEALRRHLRMRPHVVEAAPRLMPAQLDSTAARLLAGWLRRAGLRLSCGVPLRSVDAGADGRVCGVTLEDGSRIPAGLVVFSAGTRPRDELARTGGPARGERGGFLVDDLGRTGIADVWAIGDCAAVHGRCHGTVAPGYRMAEAVAGQLLGAPAQNGPGPAADGAATVLKVPGVEVASLGDVHAQAPGAVTFSRTRGAGDGGLGDRYAKLVLDSEARVLLGAVLVGYGHAYPSLRSAVGRELACAAEDLLGEVGLPAQGAEPDPATAPVGPSCRTSPR